MRNFTHIALVVFLLVSMVGITISKHFCGDVLAQTTIGTEAEPCCSTSEMPAPCDCHNEFETFALEDEFQLEKYSLKLDKVSWALVSYFIHTLGTDFFVEPDSGSLLIAYKSPPSAEPEDLFIQVQSFLL